MIRGPIVDGCANDLNDTVLYSDWRRSCNLYLAVTSGSSRPSILLCGSSVPYYASRVVGSGLCMRCGDLINCSVVRSLTVTIKGLMFIALFIGPYSVLSCFFDSPACHSTTFFISTCQCCLWSRCHSEYLNISFALY